MRRVALLYHKASWKQLARAWARAHGIEPERVCFEDANAVMVSLERTPAELGWPANVDPVIVYGMPNLDDDTAG